MTDLATLQVNRILNNKLAVSDSDRTYICLLTTHGCIERCLLNDHGTCLTICKCINKLCLCGKYCDL